jgi:acyl-CoA synthetase (NDP forming)
MIGSATITIESIAAPARLENRDVLLEHEGYELLQSIGISVPAYRFISNSDEAGCAEDLTSEMVVVKVVSSKLLHKTDVGGVAIVPREASAVAHAVEDMQSRLKDNPIAGFLVCEYVPHETAFGSEFLLGIRWTEDFGPVVVLGPGGTGAEFLVSSLKTGRDLAVMSPAYASESLLESALSDKVVAALITGEVRGGKKLMDRSQLYALLKKMLDFAALHVPKAFCELEINPLAMTEHGPVALDVLCKLGAPRDAAYPPRPHAKIERLLKPRSIAVLGVSEKMNPGHMILNNILRSGFPQERVYVIKPGKDRMEGCRCVADLASLPESVDLLILCIDSPRVPEVIEEVVENGKAKSVILISGGLGERQGSGTLEQRVRTALAMSRTDADQGPVLNGGNCLGIRSLPGQYDTLFIPSYKLPFPDAPPAPVAFISQSGALLAAKAGKLSAINPRYLISVGNQTDLTIGDYLSYLKDDPEIEVFACYVEGFRPLDGLQWLEAAREITASGRTVLLYRAGRTPSGTQATASHTASVAGDYAVCRELAQQAGVIVTDSHADFEDLTRLFCLLRGKQVSGWRLGALSNAGFEAVALADHVGRFVPASFSVRTNRKLEDVLNRYRISNVVDVRNPLDVTPIVDDEGYEAVIAAVMQDENVDIGIIGCVPLTGCLNTLAPGEGHKENLRNDSSVVSRMIRLKDSLPKAWVAVVDGGPLYDPMAALLDAGGVPTFRTADRAVRMLETYCGQRLRHP